MSRQNFNSLISFLQVFGILLVVIGHSFYGASKDNFITAWIYSFHMPLFMFISGYLFAYTMKLKGKSLYTMSWEECGKFIVKKIRRLMIPYVAISSLAFFPKALMSTFASRPVEVSFSGYLEMLAYPWDNVIIFFWFLPTLFLIFCITVFGAYSLRRLRLGFPPPLVCITLLILLRLFNPFRDILIFNIGGVAGFMIYFVAGYYFSKLDMEQKFPIKSGITACITFTLSVIFIFIPSFFGKDLLTAFNGILMSIAFGQLYVKYKWGFFHAFFGASFAIYLFSWFPQILAQQIFLSLTHAPWQSATCLAIASGFYVPFWIYKWIIGNKKKKFGKLVAILTGQ